MHSSSRVVPLWQSEQGKAVCLEMYRQDMICRERYEVDVAFCRRTWSARTWRGYRRWGPSCASLMRRRRWFARLIAVPAKWFIEDAAFQMAVRRERHWRGWFIRRALFQPFCWMLGSGHLTGSVSRAVPTRVRGRWRGALRINVTQRVVGVGRQRQLNN